MSDTDTDTYIYIRSDGVDGVPGVWWGQVDGSSGDVVSFRETRPCARLRMLGGAVVAWEAYMHPRFHPRNLYDDVFVQGLREAVEQLGGTFFVTERHNGTVVIDKKVWVPRASAREMAKLLRCCMANYGRFTGQAGDIADAFVGTPVTFRACDYTTYLYIREGAGHDKLFMWINSDDNSPTTDTVSYPLATLGTFKNAHVAFEVDDFSCLWLDQARDVVRRAGGTFYKATKYVGPDGKTEIRFSGRDIIAHRNSSDQVRLFREWVNASTTPDSKDKLVHAYSDGYEVVVHNTQGRGYAFELLTLKGDCKNVYAHRTYLWRDCADEFDAWLATLDTSSQSVFVPGGPKTTTPCTHSADDDSNTSTKALEHTEPIKPLVFELAKRVGDMIALYFKDGTMLFVPVDAVKWLGIYHDYTTKDGWRSATLAEHQFTLACATNFYIISFGVLARPLINWARRDMSGNFPPPKVYMYARIDGTRCIARELGEDNVYRPVPLHEDSIHGDLLKWIDAHAGAVVAIETRDRALQESVCKAVEYNGGVYHWTSSVGTGPIHVGYRTTMERAPACTDQVILFRELVKNW